MPLALLGAVAVLGLFMLIPAFLLLVHFAVLSNIANGDAGWINAAAYWGVGTFAGGVVYVSALSMIVFKSRNLCRWCYYYCITYAVYIGGMTGYLSSGNFLRKIETYGLMYAVSVHMQSLAYLLIALLFIIGIVKMSQLQGRGRN